MQIMSQQGLLDRHPAIEYKGTPMGGPNLFFYDGKVAESDPLSMKGKRAIGERPCLCMMSHMGPSVVALASTNQKEG